MTAAAEPSIVNFIFIWYESIEGVLCLHLFMSIIPYYFPHVQMSLPVDLAELLPDL
jgi:hypothetical protein